MTFLRQTTLQLQLLLLLFDFLVLQMALLPFLLKSPLKNHWSSSRHLLLTENNAKHNQLFLGTLHLHQGDLSFPLQFFLQFLFHLLVLRDQLCPFLSYTFLQDQLFFQFHSLLLPMLQQLAQGLCHLNFQTQPTLMYLHLELFHGPEDLNH